MPTEAQKNYRRKVARAKGERDPYPPLIKARPRTRRPGGARVHTPERFPTGAP
jgi:hypothetical protein